MEPRVEPRVEPGQNCGARPELLGPARVGGGPAIVTWPGSGVATSLLAWHSITAPCTAPRLGPT